MQCTYVQAVGRTTVNHDSESSEGTSSSPCNFCTKWTYFLRRCNVHVGWPTTASVLLDLPPRRPPKMAPLMRAKKTVTSNDADGSQKTRQPKPQTSMRTPAISILPSRSLATPMNGRPQAVPRFRKAVICVASALDSLIEMRGPIARKGALCNQAC